jgi:hypothetical protein
MEVSSLSEYDEKVHEPIMTLDQVNVGDELGNMYVGQCWVVEKFEHETISFLLVRYEGIHCASGELREYQRSDHIGLKMEVGYPGYGLPHFWRRR